jgi:hypothetical protein
MVRLSLFTCKSDSDSRPGRHNKGLLLDIDNADRACRRDLHDGRLRASGAQGLAHAVDQGRVTVDVRAHGHRIVLWLIYGVLLGDLPLIVANVAALGLAAAILACELRFG